MALRGERHLARIGLRVSHELLHSPRREGALDDEDVRDRTEDGYGLQRGRPERELLVEAFVDGEWPRRARQEDIAVSGRRGHHLRADVAAGARPVLDDDGLAP